MFDYHLFKGYFWVTGEISPKLHCAVKQAGVSGSGHPHTKASFRLTGAISQASSGGGFGAATALSTALLMDSSRSKG